MTPRRSPAGRARPAFPSSPPDASRQPPHPNPINPGQHSPQNMQALLSSTYFGPVQWYQKLCRHERVFVERYDSYRKQTYRNRCVIAAANGPQTLTVPVERQAGGQRLLTRDVRISDHGNWRHQHWNALASAYGESPFFEFYADDIRPFFERKWTFLYDFNTEICAKMCELIGIEPDVEPTTGFAAPDSPELDGTADYRDAIRPKHPLPDPTFEPRRYYQVYEAKHGFTPNLSILDLLFNMGNESLLYL